MVAVELEASPFAAEERLITPLATPEVSPGSSLLGTPDSTQKASMTLLSPASSWLPLEGVQPGRTARERAQDIIEKHRHWSHAGEGVPNHPRFVGWKSQLPPGQSTAVESMEGRGDGVGMQVGEVPEVVEQAVRDTLSPRKRKRLQSAAKFKRNH